MPRNEPTSTLNKAAIEAAIVKLKNQLPTKEGQHFDKILKENEDFKELVAKCMVVMIAAPPDRQAGTFLAAMALSMWLGYQMRGVVDAAEKPLIYMPRSS